MSGYVVLAKLAELKLRGVVRKQLRRMRTPAGALFAILGLGIAGSWIASLGLGHFATRAAGVGSLEPELVRMLLLVLVLLNVLAHVGQRGLYLQPAELDRLLSAPVPRAAIFGHRLVCSLGRALVGAIVLGAAASFRVPTVAGALIGALVLTVFLTLLGQAVSLGSALLERWVSGRVLDLLGKLGGVTVLLAGVALILVPLPELETLDPLAVAKHPFAVALGAPLQPLVDVFMSVDAYTALVRGVPCLLFVLLGFELLRRVNVDWRDVAIATSSRVGKRIDRARRLGTGASGSKVSKWAAARPVPWLLGHSPTGAVFWRKSASIIRRARVTLVFAALTLVLGVGGLLAMTRHVDGDPGWSGAFLVVFGSIYLSGSLRFDLREEIDRIEEIKAWPLESGRLFLALLLPQTAVVGTFLLVGAALLAAVIGEATALLLLSMSFLPVFLLGWVATDNFFFLLWPVRIVPGADGMLQDVGRASVLFFCRALVAGGALSLAIAAAFGVWSLLPEDADTIVRASYAAPAAWFVLLLWALVAVRSGGKALLRFDPSRLTV